MAHTTPFAKSFINLILFCWPDFWLASAHQLQTAKLQLQPSPELGDGVIPFDCVLHTIYLYRVCATWDPNSGTHIHTYVCPIMSMLFDICAISSRKCGAQRKLWARDSGCQTVSAFRDCLILFVHREKCCRYSWKLLKFWFNSSSFITYFWETISFPTFFIGNWYPI